MPSYIITVTPGTSDSELRKIQDDIVNRKGVITGEFTLIRGFSCNIPEEHYSIFAAHPNVQSMEADGVVTTQ